MNVKKNAKLLEHNMARHHKFQYKRAHKLGACSTGPKIILLFAYPFTQASERLQRVVHWSKTTYSEVVSHGHGQHDFYVEHAAARTQATNSLYEDVLYLVTSICGMLWWLL